MNTLDFLNSLFVFAACGFAGINLWKVIDHKEVKGAHHFTPMFFALWGWWNMLIFYPSLNQWWTLVAHSVLALINTGYAVMVLKYWKGK